MSRRKFNKEFKVAAVKLVLDDELPVSQVAQQLSVHPNSLYRWVNEYESKRAILPVKTRQRKWLF